MTELAALGLKIEGVDNVDTATNALNKLVTAAESMERSADKIAQSSGKATDKVKEIGKASEDSAKGVSALASVAMRAGGILLGAFSINAIRTYADTWSDLQSRVGAATKDMGGAAKQMTRLVDIANASYSSIEQTVAAYAGNVQALQDLGKSANQAADYTESLNHMLVLTATRGDRATSVQNALSKAMAVGKLQAEGLETVLANGGEVASALAAELGTTVSGLRALASDGKITGEVIANAIIKPLDDVRVRAAEMPATIADAYTRIMTNTTELVGVFDKLTGASAAVAGGIISFADSMRELSKNEELLQSIAGNLETVMDVGTVVAVLLGGKLAAAAAIAGLSFAKAAAQTVLYQVALMRMAGLSGVATAAMAAMGGPVGVVAAGLGLAYLAWQKYGKSARDNASEGVRGLVDAKGSIDDLLDGFSKLNELEQQNTLAIKTKDLSTATKDASKAVFDLGNAFVPTMAKGAAASAQFRSDFTSDIAAIVNNTSLSSEQMASALNGVITSYIDTGRATEESRNKLTEMAQRAVTAANDVNTLTKEVDALTDAQIRNRAASAYGSGDPYNDGTLYAASKTALDNLVKSALEATKSYTPLAEQMKVVKANGDQAQTALDALVQAQQGNSAEAEVLRGRIKGANDQLAKMGKAASEGVGGVKDLESAYKSLSKSILDKIDAQGLELQYGSRLTDLDKLQLQINRQFTGSKKAELQARLDIAKDQQKELAKIKAAQAAYQVYLEDQEAITAAYVAQSEAKQELWKNMAAQNIQLDEEMRMLDLEASLIGKSTEARQLAMEQLRIQIELERELRDISNNTQYDAAAKLEAEADARGRAIRKVAIAERKVYVAESDKTYEIIGQTLRDYIMGGGKDGLEYLERLARTVVLEPVVKFATQQLMGAFGAGEQGSSSGSGASMPGGSFTDWSTLGSKAGNWLIDQSTDLAVKGFGTLSKNAFTLGDTIKGVDSWLKEVPGMSGGIGSALGYAGALYSLSQGQYGSAVGAAIGTAILPGIGTMIGSTLGGLVDGLFGDSRPKSRRVGGAFSTSDLDDYQVSSQLALTDDFKKAVESRSNDTLDNAVEALALTVTSSFNALGKYTGGRKIGTTAAFADEPSLDDRYSWAAFQLFDELTGKVLNNWNSGKALDPDGEKAFAVLSGQMSAAMVAELKASDIPGWMRTVLDSLGTEITLDGLSGAMQQIALIDAGFATLSRTMGMFADLSGATQTALLHTIGGMENLSTAASSFYNSFFTEAERMETLSRQVQEALKALNVDIDPRMGEMATRQYRATIEAAFAAGNGELAAQLLAMNQEFAKAADYATKAALDMQQAAQELLQSAADAAMANLEAAIAREQKYWQAIATASQSAISSLSTALGLMNSNARELFGTVNSAQQMMAAQGMVYIENALAGVRGGMSATSYGGLSNAISAARSGISGGNYASQFERDRDTLVLANQLSELGKLTDVQLSVEERALKAANAQIEQLDKTLEFWQQAMDFDGIKIDKMMSIEQAIAALGPIIAALQLNNAAGAYANAIKAATPGSEMQKSALYKQMLASGLTDAQIRAQVDKTTGVQTDTDWDYLKKISGVPSYDVGANYIPNDQLAFLHRGEAVVPEEFNPWAGGKSLQGSDQSAQLAQQSEQIEKLTEEVRDLTRTVLRLLQKWDVEGLPQPRLETV